MDFLSTYSIFKKHEQSLAEEMLHFVVFLYTHLFVFYNYHNM